MPLTAERRRSLFNFIAEVWREQAFPGGSAVKILQEPQETQVPSLGREDPLGEGMATHSSVLAWRVPWTGEPGGPQCTGHRDSDTNEQLSTHAGRVGRMPVQGT